MKLYYITTLVLLLLFTGCSKQPVVPQEPKQLTEAYLLKNINSRYIKDLNITAVYPLSYSESVKLNDQNATITTTLVAIMQGDLNATLQKSSIQVRCTLVGSSWGDFKTALDKNGNSLVVRPTTSNIRDGQFSDNFIIDITPEQLEIYADEDADFLLLGADRELLINIPAIYFGALYRYLL